MVDLNYEIVPKKTLHSEVSKQKRRQKASQKAVFIGFIGLAIIILTAVLTRYYWVVGYMPGHVEGWVIPALWVNFWKIIFIFASFAFLYAVVSMNKNMPKQIANHTTLQLICN